MGKDNIELNSGKLKLSVEPFFPSINLYWDNVQLTKRNGFMGIIGIANGSRYYSDKASWKTNITSDNEVSILLEWPNLPVREYWHIGIRDEKTIYWRVSLEILSKIFIREKELGLLISPDYTKWLNSSEEGHFPQITSGQNAWQKIKLDNYLSKSIGARESFKGGLYKPTIILDFRENETYTEPEIRNSHIFDNLRGLFTLIKPDHGSIDNSTNSRYARFEVKVRLINDRVMLTNYLKSCKKDDDKRRQELRLIKRKNTDKNKSFYSYLLLRFVEHCQKRGVLYAIYRGFAYIVYCLRTGNLLYTLFSSIVARKNMQDRHSKTELEIGKLRLSIDASYKIIDIYWSGAKITRDLGFISVVSDRLFTFRRLYSNQAFWKVTNPAPNQVNINLYHPLFPLKQMWQITLENEKSIKWEIRIIPDRKIILAEKEAGIMLSSDYTHWINSSEEGEFLNIEPNQKEWKDMNLWNLSSTSLGVRSCGQGREYKPAIMLDFGQTQEETKPIIRNSDFRSNLRILLAQICECKSAPAYKRGTQYNIFSGRIKISEDEKAIDQRITEYKQALYRQRLPFIEEKMNKRYLPDVLKPVEVLLANLPWEKDKRKGVRAGSRWPHIKNAGEEAYLPFPFFLAYCASVFLQRGVRVRIIDAIAEDIDRESFVKLVNELSPKLFVAEVSTPSLKNDLGILKEIDRKETKIAVCGLDYHIRLPVFLEKNDFIDFSMVGEYEYTALDLFEQINNGNNFKGVAGLIYRQGSDITINPSRPLINNLDELPWPLREQLPMEEYMDTPGNIPVPSVQMLASRGCPFGCIFCAWPQLMYSSSRYRMRDAKAITDEIEYLVRERKFKSIYFDDDTFNINKNNVLDISREIKERKINVPWAIMARADMMDRDMLLKMKEAGLHAVKYGIESAEQALLDKAGKNMDLKQAESMVNFTKLLGIKTHLTFTFGLPGETEETIKRTIDYAVKLNPDTVQFSIMTPYPGTEYYNQLETKGYISSTDWSDYDGASRSVIRTEHLSPCDLEKAKEEALRVWKKHNRSRKSVITMPFDKELRAALKNNLKTRGILCTLRKTARYIFNI